MFHLLLPFMAMSFTFIVLMIVFIIIIYIIIKILSYIFESIGIMNISKKENFKYSFISWIPGISYYILGQYCTDKNKTTKIRNGLIYSILTIIKIVFIITIFKTTLIKDSWIFLLFFIIYFIFYFIIDMIYMYNFYKKIYKNYKVYTLITILTLGLAKPIFIFISKKKIK